MFSVLKKNNILLLCLISNAIFAKQYERFVRFNYNFQSINSSISNQQCEELFKFPIFYKIDNDKVIFEKSSNFNVSNYQRSNVTFLNKNAYLFTGTSTYTFNFNGKNQTATENLSFVLKIKEKMIRGSFIIDGYCKGNLIGTEESTHDWPLKNS